MVREFSRGEGELRSHNVLLVDDDEITLELVQHILEEFVVGDITAFSSSIKAVAFLEKVKPGELGLVICDWQMPDHNGIDVLKRFRVRDKKTPFLMLTGNATRDLVLTAKKAGATDFIAKPFKNTDLFQKVESLLNGTNSI